MHPPRPPEYPRRLLRVAAVLSLALLLGGCSFGLRLAYDQLGRLARWAVEDYVRLDAAQKQAFDDEFAALQAWHRQSELPRYAAGLRELAARAEHPEPLGELALSALDQVGVHADALWQRAQPGLVRLLATLSDEQLAAYEQRIRRDLDEDAAEREAASDAQRRKRWLRTWRDGLERWLGPLNDDQRSELDTAWLAEQPFRIAPAQRRQEQLANLERAVALLRSRHQPGLAQRLDDEAWSSDPQRDRDSSARQRALIRRIFDAADARQRRHLRTTLLDYATDCERLAGPPPS